MLCTFISSHTFAKEFDYICSQTEDGFIMYFTVNTTDKTIFHKFSREENQRYEINKKLEVLNWNFPRVFTIDELTLDSIFIRYFNFTKEQIYTSFYGRRTKTTEATCFVP